MKVKTLHTPNPPLIVIGMHRSGTSLLSQALQQNSIFMGVRQNSHQEALFFMRINEEFMNLAHAHWDNPAPMTYLLENDDAVKEITAVTQEKLHMWETVTTYWGYQNALALYRQSNPLIRWGWKDPRNSFTLPIWLNLFPNAWVIHMVRNGIDVANSLCVREQRRKMQPDYLLSFRCMTLEGAFSLWVEYESMCRRNSMLIAPERYLQVKFEDLITHPQKTLDQIFSFMRISSPNRKHINDFVKQINHQRAFAFKNDERLRIFYETHLRHPLMKLYGYD